MGKICIGLAISLIVIITLSGCINLPPPVFAYPDSNDIIGQATTLEEARQICENIYSGNAFTQPRETGGWECLPIV